jgi:hypothetical protein
VRFERAAHWTRISLKPQSLELRFRALLAEGGTKILFHRDAYNRLGETSG